MDIPWLLGFLEGHGCFSLTIKKNGNRIGYQTTADFTIRLPLRQRQLLEEIHAFLKIGNIYQNGDTATLKATSLPDAQRLVTFLGDTPFVSEAKSREFAAWKQCVTLMGGRLHHTLNGILEIARLRDGVHTRPLWNKKTYCSLRADTDPCHVYRSTHQLPAGCRICWNEPAVVSLPPKEAKP